MKVLWHDHKTFGVERKLLHRQAGGVPLFLLYHTVVGRMRSDLHYYK